MADISLLIDSFTKHIEVDKNAESFLRDICVESTVRKKMTLVRAGEVHHYTYFVAEGCLRSYSTDANGFEHVVQFAPAGWWISDLASNVNGEAGNLSIDALLDSRLIMLSRHDQEKLLNRFPIFEKFFRILLENSVAASQQRLMDYMGLSAAERYEGFCKRYPGLMSILPQKQIAAYLGVTPEFLSKMKAQLLRKKPIHR